MNNLKNVRVGDYVICRLKVTHTETGLVLVRSSRIKPEEVISIESRKFSAGDKVRHRQALEEAPTLEVIHQDDDIVWLRHPNGGRYLFSADDFELVETP